MRFLYTMFMLIGANLCAVMFLGCSDFYHKDFVHIPSAHNAPKKQKIQKENEIQAMRKGQILKNNRTQILMIVRYMNDISDEFVKNDKGEVFLVEIYSREGKLPANLLTFSLQNVYKNIQSNKVSALNKQELGDFVPDIAYNDVYKVSFDSMGFRGRESLKFIAHIKDIGDISFDFGYTQPKSNPSR
ncbi:hypothetical protein [Helicobacter japonicus]|uniref:hypothetical protein n=1 Tax=Helicobacter japonicus TaxID=425400 RepID=UPI0023EFDB84|nr:hypothetical protein [Helicobacter japonicus]